MSLLTKIWKNKSDILNGLVNRFSVNEQVQEIRNNRLEVCNTCDNNSKNAKINSNYKSNRIDAHCILCGCTISTKVGCLHCECPIKKWEAVTTAEESERIKDIIKSKEDNKEIKDNRDNKPNTKENDDKEHNT